MAVEMEMVRLHKKGFTLIEIIVTLLIASIVMLVAGTMIFNSLNFFQKTATSDADKQVLDDISEVIKDELMFATEVKLAVDADRPQGDGWDCLYEKDGYLMKNGKLLYEKNFYNGNTLQWVVKPYKNDSRMDSRLTLQAQGEEVYRTSITLELINLKAALAKDHELTSFETEDSIDMSVQGETGYKVYYRRGSLNISESYEQTGTVEDELMCFLLSEDQQLEDYAFQSGKLYFRGEYAFVDDPAGPSGKQWYRKTTTAKSGSSPKTTSGWKCLSVNWDSMSAYEVGDVVKSTYGYFRCKKSVRGGSESGEPGKYYATGDALNYKDNWETDPIPMNELNTSKSENFCVIDTSGMDYTVGGEMLRCPNTEKQWQASEIFPGDYVRYPKNGTVSYVWVGGYSLPINRQNAWTAPGIDGWKKIDEAYDEKSVYFTDDIVLYNGKYHQCLHDNTAHITPNHAMNNGSWTIGYTTVDDLLAATNNYPQCRIYGGDND
ncbi:prepilin-type N-terminal cleavage/methylation domain-containing protein [[Clostridium] innocuum]|nr:prepilin-type N-terminal cleavage/methylation domain-containing protein [Erysipelotrichaceae bacterium]MCR0382799.1 prepilin-type N-terminal cleavage/methylation domain-containing protein [[Clostridium] innocuum]MCR0412068.1 prepilin-type N-terminal cleavage/methylation domain-containing protein [[Clostridium] innocuum]MCR0535103.1 prepilin-type N-terminal cleavage/methylation domain-containing protein [[Clostridium] innocuum]MCR0537689.1 prepilin-type N-terminal cleavage/methylation domain-